MGKVTHNYALLPPIQDTPADLAELIGRSGKADVTEGVVVDEVTEFSGLTGVT
ncbi:hypothetical protein H6F38_34755, partial [Paenibacillus sp. EKM208P]